MNGLGMKWETTNAASSTSDSKPSGNETLFTSLKCYLPATITYM